MNEKFMQGATALDMSAVVEAGKLQGKPWATSSEMLAVAEDGKQRQLTMVDLDTLPGWLFSIDARCSTEKDMQGATMMQNIMVAEEGVSQTQVQNDLKDTRGDTSVSPRLDSGKVKGKDGKEYPAKKKALARQPAPNAPAVEWSKPAHWTMDGFHS